MLTNIKARFRANPKAETLICQSFNWFQSQKKYSVNVNWTWQPHRDTKEAHSSSTERSLNDKTKPWTLELVSVERQ